MAKQRPAWVKDAVVYAGFTLLDGMLMAVGYAAAARFGFGALPPWLECWWWACAAPVWLARTAECPEEWGWPIFWANPFVYGLVWWAVWRMVKLLRAKPVD